MSGSRYKAFYFPSDFEETFRRFREIVRKENRSISEVVRELIEVYVKRKWPGNPQKPLTLYVEGVPSFSRPCAWFRGWDGRQVYCAYREVKVSKNVCERCEYFTPEE